MTFLRSIFHYPLLGRELTERAARRRTYIVRVLYGAAIYAMFGLVLQRALLQQTEAGTGVVAFGFGYDLLRSLVNLLAFSLLLIQPAIMATALTREKERDAFGLLLLTRLSPTKILLEKYLAGLFPTATLLLLALPLAAVTMGYGGVSVQLLVAGGMVLVSTWLMVGAWAIFCSAWCRTSLGALLLAYLGGAAILFAAPLAYSVLRRDVLFGSTLIGVEVPGWLWALWPQEVFAALLQYQRETFSTVAGSGNATAFAIEAAKRCGALFGAAAIFLLGARIVLLPRSAAKPVFTRERILRLSRLLPLAWRKKRPPRADLPGDAPVAWREHSRSILGGQQHFFYVAFLVWGATFALSLFLLSLYPPTRGPERLHRLGIFTGCVGMFVLVSTSVISLLSERINQTLDILFTTPLGIGQLLQQKAQSVARYWALFGVMLAIIFGAEAWSEYEYVRSGSTWQTFGQQWATGLLALVIYPPLVIWVSFLFAALWRKRARAIFGALALFAIWSLAPLMALEFLDPRWRDEQHYLWYSLLSPFGILDANANDRLPWFAKAGVSIGRLVQVQGVPWVPVAVNFGFYALMALLARWFCLRSADRLLRR
jgi:ABC-type transport system involved in multi-copper enzyme maturation permease subunit